MRVNGRKSREVLVGCGFARYPCDQWIRVTSYFIAINSCFQH